MKKQLAYWFFRKINNLFIFLLLQSLREKNEIGGQIVIHSIPKTDVGENTKEMRKLWIGCRITGGIRLLGKFNRVFFFTGMGNCSHSLTEMHGAEADGYINFWNGWHENWDEGHKQYIGNICLGNFHGMTFDYECFCFVPSENELSKIQRRLWRLLGYFGNRCFGEFKGIQF